MKKLKEQYRDLIVDTNASLKKIIAEKGTLYIEIGEYTKIQLIGDALYALTLKGNTDLLTLSVSLEQMLTILEGASKPRTWARKCTATGEPMNEGYVAGDGEAYFKYTPSLVQYLREECGYRMGSKSRILEEAFDEGVYYHTSWEDDHQYIMIDNVLHDIDEMEGALSYVENDDCNESEIWEDNKGNKFEVPVEIIRDFKNMKSL